jgi:ubiquinone/menaquinone biosynthesis C-methylase UbiE
MELYKKTIKSWKHALINSKANFINNFNLKEGNKVLVLCCGIGSEAILSRKLVGESGYVMGIDINKKAIEIANEKKNQLKLDNLDFIVGDAKKLGDTVIRFDRVCCLYGMHFFKYQSDILDYWSNYLKPGGTLGVLEWLKSHPNKIITPIFNIVYKYIPQNSPNKMISSKSNNNFIWSNIGTKLYEYNIYYPNPKTYWAIFRRNELYSKLYKEIGYLKLIEMEKEVEEFINRLPAESFEEITRVRAIFAHKAFKGVS